MKTKNYYEILGVSLDATQDQIKTAYRQKAKQYHPDVNKTQDAQDKMKEINVAYDTLSNPQKKQQYDLFRQNPNINMNRQYNQPNHGYYEFNEAMFEEIFRQFYQQEHPNYQANRRRAPSVLNTFFKIIIYFYLFEMIAGFFRFIFSF